MLAMMDEEALDILFIEDDPDIAEMYRLKLELDGYWVRIVTSDSAVSAARAHCPEILFLDMSSGLPERLGILTEIRDAVRRPDLPSIVLSPFGRDTLPPSLLEGRGSFPPPLGEGRVGARLTANDYLVRVPTADRV